MTMSPSLAIYLLAAFIATAALATLGYHLLLIYRCPSCRRHLSFRPTGTLRRRWRVFGRLQEQWRCGACGHQTWPDVVVEENEPFTPGKQ
ncbi:MAG: hypothetical protein ACFCBW_14350 [Candidatus Competibacterales bacterium]